MNNKVVLDVFRPGEEHVVRKCGTHVVHNCVIPRKNTYVNKSLEEYVLYCFITMPINRYLPCSVLPPNHTHMHTRTHAHTDPHTHTHTQTDDPNTPKPTATPDGWHCERRALGALIACRGRAGG